jgi:hypothetical protein
MSELTVIFKDEHRTYRQKFLAYQPYCIDLEDDYILQCIEEAKKNFDGEPDTVQIKIHMEFN